MKKCAVLHFLILITGTDVVSALTDQLNESILLLRTKPQNIHHLYSVINMHQESILWFRKTDSIMIYMNNRQWDSMIKKMNVAQRDGIMNYRILVKRDSMQMNRITPAQLVW